MKLFLSVMAAMCLALCVVGCSKAEDGGDASAANQEIVNRNPDNIPQVSEEDASGDASMMGGPSKGGN